MRKKKDSKQAAEKVKKSIPTEQAPISKRDIEAKFRQVKTDVDQVAADKKNQIIPAVSVVAILILLIAYLLGQRTGKKKSAVVQIRRI